METLVFEVPLVNLTGSKGLNVAQDMWMLQPSPKTSVRKKRGRSGIYVIE
jgi:hypothetical protein